MMGYYDKLNERFEEMWKLKEHITKTPTPKEGIDWKGLCKEFFEQGAILTINIILKEKGGE